MNLTVSSGTRGSPGTEHRRCVRPTASRRCTPEISLCSCPFEAAASSAKSQRLPARQAPSALIPPTRIAGHELASWNRFVRFQVMHVGVRAGRRQPNTSAMLICCRDAATQQRLRTSSLDVGRGRVRQAAGMAQPESGRSDSPRPTSRRRHQATTISSATTVIGDAPPGSADSAKYLMLRSGLMYFELTFQL